MYSNNNLSVCSLKCILLCSEGFNIINTYICNDKHNLKIENCLYVPLCFRYIKQIQDPSSSGELFVMVLVLMLIRLFHFVQLYNSTEPRYPQCVQHRQVYQLISLAHQVINITVLEITLYTLPCKSMPYKFPLPFSWVMSRKAVPEISIKVFQCFRFKYTSEDSHNLLK